MKTSFCIRTFQIFVATSKRTSLSVALISTSIDEHFVPLIRDIPPKSTSLGLRIQQLVLEDLSHTASLVAGETIDNIEYKRALIHASSEYVLALEEIHETFLQKKENGAD